jgi:hypothetical protein
MMAVFILYSGQQGNETFAVDKKMAGAKKGFKEFYF